MRICGHQSLDEGCNKPGDGVPKPVWKGGVGRDKWESFTKEGAFGVILKKERKAEFLNTQFSVYVMCNIRASPVAQW